MFSPIFLLARSSSLVRALHYSGGGPTKGFDTQVRMNITWVQVKNRKMDYLLTSPPRGGPYLKLRVGSWELESCCGLIFHFLRISVNSFFWGILSFK